MISTLKKQKGFTLIEIVLVLAIAALIIVMVFLALSGANKSRRDTQRKQDAAQLVSAVEDYQSNNNGALPGNGGQWEAGYFTQKDPTTGNLYTYTATPATAPPVGSMAYDSGYICNGAVGTTTGASAANFAVVVGLEVGGSACYSNN